MRRKSEKTDFEEINSLAEAAGYDVVGSIDQHRKADPRFHIGKGKAEELAGLVKDLKAEKVIFDNDLKSVQTYNLAKITGVEVIDRFRLILEIFARRSSTKEAKLQIMLAELRYQLPRARMSVRLAMGGEQPGFLGLGRYKVDVYFDTIKKQIVNIKSKLRKIQMQRQIHRIKRAEMGFSVVSLAGYTNSGKTTLFNYLTRESKAVDTGLFTTLTTTVRSISFFGKKAILTDTVGFIDRIPLLLVESFRSTLEETIHADMIILVVDFHEAIDKVKRKLLTCINTLKDIGVGGAPIVTAFNKIDLMTKKELKDKIEIFREIAPNPLVISALKEENIEILEKTVAENLGEYIKASFLLPLNNLNTSFVYNIHDQVDSLKMFFEGGRIKFEFMAPPSFVGKISGQVKSLGGDLLKISA